METEQIKQEIQDFISHADEHFLRLIYSMVESEKSETDFYNTTVTEMQERATQSLDSVNKGNTRNIHVFH